jgi:hypothetical protein
LLVFGRGIKVEQNAHPSKEEIAAVHAKYKKALVELYERHRSKVPGYERKELIIV